MRHIIFLFLLLPAFLWGQYPDNPRKQRLGYQTTGAGLTYIKDGAPTHTPADDEDTWMVLDTTNNILYYWDETAGAWENLLNDITRDTVFQITNVSDTTTLAPVQGDVFINATADTLGLYAGPATGWVLFYGGSVEQADGLTILGYGTGGAPFRVDTTLLATRTYADSLSQVVYDSLGIISLYANMPGSVNVPACESTTAIIISGIVHDPSIIAGSNIMGDIVESNEAAITVTYIQAEDGWAYFEASGFISAGSYAPTIEYVPAGLTIDGLFNVNEQPCYTDTLTQYLKNNSLTPDFVGKYDGAGGMVDADIEDDGNVVTIGFNTSSEVDIIPLDTATIGGAVSRLGGQAANRVTVDDNEGTVNVEADNGVTINSTLRVTGSDGTPISLIGRDGDGDISGVTLGDGLTLSSGTLAANDTVTTLLQDSILIYSVAGVEVNRDTISTSGSGGVTGSGTTNYLPKWTSPTSLGSSGISDNGTTTTILRQVTVGGNANPDPVYTPFFVGDNTGSSQIVGRIGAGGWSTTDASSFRLFRARGTSDTPIEVQTGDVLGTFQFWGYDNGGNFRLGAQLIAVVTGTPTTNSVPSKFVFDVWDGATKQTVMSLFNTGQLYLSNASASIRLNPHNNTLINEAGLISYNSVNSWFLGRDGVDEFYLAKTSVAGSNFTSHRIPFSDADGALSESPDLYWDGNLNVASYFYMPGILAGPSYVNPDKYRSVIEGESGEGGMLIVTPSSMDDYTLRLHHQSNAARKGVFRINGNTEGSPLNTLWVGNGGYVGIGKDTADARLHLPAGTATANTASLKIDEGVNTSTPQDGEINHVADRLNFTSGSTVNVIAHLSDIPDQNASYYQETERQYTLTTTGADTVITVDTLSVAIETDSVSMSSGLIENLKADTVRWQVSYDFFYSSDEDACYALMDITNDGTEEPVAIPGSAARAEQVSASGGQMPGRTFLVDVPPGEKIRLCVKGSVGVATQMNISYLTISINEINR